MRETVPGFAALHKDLLVIVCDPKSDNIFVGYNNFVVSAKMKSADGKKTHVVREVLKHSQFDKSIDSFLVGIMEVMRLPLKAGSVFYNFLDGALFNISKALRKKDLEPKPGAVLSPFVAQGEEVKK